MHSVRRTFGGYAVIHEDEEVQTFTGKGAKAKAEARAEYLNTGKEQPDLPAAAASGAATSGRGNRGRGGAYRGG